MNEDGERLWQEIEEDRKRSLENPVKYYRKRDDKVFKRNAQYSEHYPSSFDKQLKLAGRPQPEVCEVCHRSGRITFDHCHVTGKFRGWICLNCNIALGHVADDPEILEKLAAYLRISQS